MDFEFSLREAIALSVLFCSQVLVEVAIVRDFLALPLTSYELLLAFSAVYLLAGGGLFVSQRDEIRALLGRTIRTAGDAWRPPPAEAESADD